MNDYHTRLNDAEHLMNYLIEEWASISNNSAYRINKQTYLKDGDYCIYYTFYIPLTIEQDAIFADKNNDKTGIAIEYNYDEYIETERIIMGLYKMKRSSRKDIEIIKSIKSENVFKDTQCINTHMELFDAKLYQDLKGNERVDKFKNIDKRYVLDTNTWQYAWIYDYNINNLFNEENKMLNGELMDIINKLLSVCTTKSLIKYIRNI